MKHYANKRLSRGLALVAVDILFFGITDPARAPSLLLMAGFLLLTYTLYVFLSLVVVIADHNGLSLGRHRHRYVAVIASIVAMLIALQSMGELGGRDIIVLIPLAFLSYLYISYNYTKQAT